MQYSLIIPFYNEEGNVKLLHEEILSALSILKKNYNCEVELIYVDDGSTDETFNNLTKLNFEDCEIKILKHRVNYSQSIAITNAISYSKYDNIIILDGDLQNNPIDIDKLMKIYEKENIDVIIGYRKNRKDNYLIRILPSLIANKLIKLMFNVNINDHGCALKICKKNIFEPDNTWGDFHRMLISRLSNKNYKIKEIAIDHRERISGKSKYGLGRIFNVIIDIVYQKISNKFEKRAIYFFGRLSIYSALSALGVFSWMIVLKLIYKISFISTPLPSLIILLSIASIIFISFGFLMQSQIANYSDQNNKNKFKIISKDDLEKMSKKL